MLDRNTINGFKFVQHETVSIYTSIVTFFFFSIVTFWLCFVSVNLKFYFIYECIVFSIIFPTSSLVTRVSFLHFITNKNKALNIGFIRFACMHIWSNF